MVSFLQNFYEKAVVGTVAFICFGIGVADIFGLPDIIPGLDGKVPSVGLTLLSLIAGYITFLAPSKEVSRHADLSNQITQLDDTIRQTFATKVQVFKDFSQCLTYANNRIKKARMDVSSVYWDVSVNFSQVIARNVLHREIFIIDDANRQQYQDVLHARISSGGSHHSCAYYRVAKDVSLQFIIIDRSEVIFLSGLAFNNISIQNPQIVNMLQYHYEEMWQKATKLKRYDRIAFDRIDLATMKTVSRPVVYSEDLERCIRKCLETHEKIKQAASQSDGQQNPYRSSY